jgi:hypothetical protein
MFLLGFSMWTYATWKHRLVDEDLDPGLIKGGRSMGYVYFTILLLAIGLSFVSPLISTIIYGVFVMIIVTFTIVGKETLVFSLPQREKRAT